VKETMTINLKAEALFKTREPAPALSEYQKEQLAIQKTANG
jgi:hypothetical protein